MERKEEKKKRHKDDSEKTINKHNIIQQIKLRFTFKKIK